MVGNGGVRGSTGVMGDVVKRCRYVWQARYQVKELGATELRGEWMRSGNEAIKQNL